MDVHRNRGAGAGDVVTLPVSGLTRLGVRIDPRQNLPGGRQNLPPLSNDKIPHYVRSNDKKLASLVASRWRGTRHPAEPTLQRSIPLPAAQRRAGLQAPQARGPTDTLPGRRLHRRALQAPCGAGGYPCLPPRPEGPSTGFLWSLARWRYRAGVRCTLSLPGGPKARNCRNQSVSV